MSKEPRKQLKRHLPAKNVPRLLGLTFVVILFLYLVGLCNSRILDVRLQSRWEFTLKKMGIGDIVGGPYDWKELQLHIGPLTFVYYYDYLADPP